MKTDSFERFVGQLLEILNDRDCFSNEREDEVEKQLVDAFVEFAGEKGFGSEVEARGMRAGLGALSGRPPDSYIVQGNDDSEKDPLKHALQIWLLPAERKIQITIQEERFGIGKTLAEIIRATGVAVHFLTTKQYERVASRIFNDEFWELSKDCRH